MRKLIDIPDAIIPELKQMAEDKGQSFKKFIEFNLAELVKSKKEKDGNKKV